MGLIRSKEKNVGQKNTKIAKIVKKNLQSDY